MAVGSPALDGKRIPELRRSGVPEQLFAADGPSVSALNDKNTAAPSASRLNL
jgi:hypothetical protein